MDVIETLTDELSSLICGMARRHRLLRPTSDLLGFVRMFVDVAHQPRRVVEIRFCPQRTLGVRLASGGNRTLAPADQIGGVGAHEVEVARVARRDHGLSEGHCFSHGETEALAAVKRHVAIGDVDERCKFVRIEVPVDQQNVRSVVDGEPQALKVGHALVSIDDFEDEGGSIARTECPCVRIDEPERVLAFEDAEQVEAEQEKGAIFRQAQLSSVDRFRDVGSDDRMRNGEDGL